MVTHVPNRFKLNWLAWEATPYNDVLFAALAADPELDLTVYYRYDKMAIHPWRRPLRQEYVSHVYHARSALSLDLDMIRLSAKDDDAIFVLVGWPGPTVKTILALLTALRRKFIFWTDTPNLQYQPGSAGLPRVVECSVTGIPYPGWQARLRRQLYQMVFAGAGAVMSTGRPGVEALKALGCPEPKVVSMPFFVALPPLPERRLEDYQLSIASPFTFVASGQFVTRKGYDVAIEALGKIRDRVDVPFRLVFLGDGPERAALQALCVGNRLEDIVVFAGWQEPDQVEQILHSSHVFVHPALRDPFPVAVLEAMAAGLPVLGSSASGSVLDRVVSGENGFVHSAGDAEELAQHMMMFLAEPGRAFEMGRAARQTAEAWPVERGTATIIAACAMCAR